MARSLDIVKLLEQQLATLPPGSHILGLKAVLLHIDAALGHLDRGRTDMNDTPFTDSIYRTNQAFEGSVKEAYRVLAGKDPAQVSPFVIEQYLEKHSVFRARVLSLFKNYRTEWRNASTHDHLLDFDESEAVVAITTVSTFALLLADQIAETLARNAAHKQAASAGSLKITLGEPVDQDTLDLVARQLVVFSSHYASPAAAPSGVTESQFIGSIAGFLESTLPGLKVVTHGPLPTSVTYADLIVERIGQKVLIEVKRAETGNAWERGLLQVQQYLTRSGIRDGIFYAYRSGGQPLVVTRHNIDSPPQRIITLIPKR